MAPPISVLVIGVGQFGRHYADILSRLNCRRLLHVPQIGRLIVTRTHFNSAERLAESLQKMPAAVLSKWWLQKHRILNMSAIYWNPIILG